MAPALDIEQTTRTLPSHQKNGGSYPSPWNLTGALEKFAYEDTTPAIGREFPDVNIVDDLLNASDADEAIRDLAITISQRGVVFFRAQDNLTDELQKRLVHRLGQLTGKPADSTLHIHPILNDTSEFGVGDNQISTISSLQRKKFFKHERQRDKRRYDSAQWHSDIQFEPVPADYTSLRLTELPKSGGDTLWASGYDLYDRFSKPYQKFLDDLTATFTGEGFLTLAKNDPENVKLYEGPRGNSANIGRELRAVHPLVRTNPVTGWKSIFAIGPFPRYINELSSQESEELLAKLKQMIIENHDLQVRFKWRNKNDLGKALPAAGD
ncbi:taurine catabolism dioxygenase [Hypoxylon cercidicola]|nr:taurine catabolism dioxygenase [Hypoxylon cercidicola]